MPTVETTRLTYFLDSLITNKHHVMFVGNTGTGKTAIMINRLKNMDTESHSYYTINMNSFSDAPSLQVILEQPLEKKSGACVCVCFHCARVLQVVYFLLCTCCIAGCVCVCVWYRVGVVWVHHTQRKHCNCL